VHQQPSIDRDLAHRCGEGDRRAFAAAVERYLPSLLRFARMNCEGELAATEILVRAIENAAREVRSCGDARSLLAWLMREIHLSCSTVARPAPATHEGRRHGV
jgi:DNA-directed RNA polymerase specialized sigma24 family protein